MPVSDLRDRTDQVVQIRSYGFLQKAGEFLASHRKFSAIPATLFVFDRGLATGLRVFACDRGNVFISKGAFD